MKRLAELVAGRAVRLSGDAPVGSVVLDSRVVSPGALFVAMPGMVRESEQFLPSAIANGASSVVVHSEEGFQLAVERGIAAVQILPATFDDEIWRICDAFYDHPTRHIRVVGVTGTNGKTTTAWLMRDMLEALGLRTAYLGTLGFELLGESRELANTTPFAVELFALLAEARDRGVQAVAMEVSSHALAQRRVDGVEFDAAVFTNLTQDHLDYHQTMAAYEAAKYRLFTELPRQSTKTFLGAVNVGDPVGHRWTESGNFLTYAVDPSSSVDLAGRVRSVGLDRIELALKMEGQTNASAIAPLGGTYNVENLVSAAAGVYALGRASNLWGESPSNLAVIAELMGRVRPVPGRFEAVPNNAGIGVIVDYAHTPDALEKVLDAIRPLTLGRVITVFGCGGDRDRTKRPKMARSASLRSDLTVITSDNPRTENPATILAEVQLGVADGRTSVSIVDRGEAVAHAVAKARPGDVVVIAGKGHENYQIIGRTKFPMDDRDLARRALEARR